MAISPSFLEEAPLLKGLIGGKKVVGQNEAAAASDVKIRMVMFGEGATWRFQGFSEK